MNARQTLLSLVENPDWTEIGAGKIAQLRLQAAQEQFDAQKNSIPVLARRAKETGITAIKSFADIVPLLFAHTVYKSYPNTFIENNRWSRMLDWLNTLSTGDPRGIDVSDVQNADEWIQRLHENGHCVLATSGTSGKCSFLNAASQDRATKVHQFRHLLGWPGPVPNNDRLVYFLGPKDGPNSAIDGGKIFGEVWSKANGYRAMFEEPLRVSDVSAANAFKKRMAAGEASPDEISAFQHQAKQQSEKSAAAMAETAQEILARRHEPMIIMGLWAQLMDVIQKARELGVEDGDWHPDTRVNAGGGVKGTTLPSDYKAQVKRFFGAEKMIAGYGMTEMYNLLPRCPAGRYHLTPAIIPLMLDATGENLLPETSGVVEGRFGFLDLVFTGRWGGIITGDRVQMDCSEQCECGRSGPTILDNITRFARLGSEKMTLLVVQEPLILIFVGSFQFEYTNGCKRKCNTAYYQRRIGNG